MCKPSSIWFVRLFPVSLVKFRVILNSTRIKGSPEEMAFTHILQKTLTTTTIWTSQDLPSKTYRDSFHEGGEKAPIAQIPRISWYIWVHVYTKATYWRSLKFLSMGNDMLWLQFGYCLWNFRFWAECRITTSHEMNKVLESGPLFKAFFFYIYI